jgi:hypothetical protein
MLSSPLVPLLRGEVADAAAGRRAQVDGDLRHAGTREIVDGDRVGTAPCGELDLLDAAEVHGDGADVAGEAHPPVVGRDADLLVDVGTVEDERIGAVLTVDNIGAVAGIPDERVVACAELRRIVAAAANDDVIAITAEQRVVSVAAGDRVVAGAAVDSELDQIGKAVPGGNNVVAAVRVDDEILGRANIDGEGRRVGAVEAYARTVGRDGKGFGAVTAVDLRRVDAVAAFEEVGVVARIPDHAIVAGFAEHLVVAISANQRVVARAAEQQVVAAFAEEGVVARAAEQLVRARAASQHVVAGAAEQQGGGERPVGFVERDRVVAALAEYLDLSGISDRGCAALDGYGPPVHENLPSSIAAGHDRVIEGVTELGEQVGGGRKRRFDSHDLLLTMRRGRN